MKKKNNEPVASLMIPVNILLLSRVISGSQMPMALGVLGTAREPLIELVNKLKVSLFGYPSSEDIFNQIIIKNKDTIMEMTDDIKNISRRSKKSS